MLLNTEEFCAFLYQGAIQIALSEKEEETVHGELHSFYPSALFSSQIRS